MRLQGLDLARFFALSGMVIVNFTVASNAVMDGGFFQTFEHLFEGRAAATFVVLAGIGLGLAARKGSVIGVTFRRAGFLMLIGLADMLVFSADIIHYYAVYFLFGAFLVQISNRWLMGLIALIIIISLAMLIMLDFDAGWNWETYDYAGFWTLTGFVRNLFFHGWYPVFPWLVFLIIGIMFSRLDLAHRKTQITLILAGGMAVFLAETLSAYLSHGVSDPELLVLVQTAPVPAMPLYLLAGSGVAALVIGLCLLVQPLIIQWRWLETLAITGRQTLTLYFAHIYIGMGMMQALGLLESPPIKTAMLASMVFLIAAILFANIWRIWFAHGPLEWLMRKITG